MLKRIGLQLGFRTDPFFDVSSSCKIQLVLLLIWIILSPFKSIYEIPKDFSSVSFSVEYRILTVGALRNELQHIQHVIVIINNKYFTIDETNFFVRLLLPMLLLLINFNSFVAILIAMISFVSIEMNPIWIILPTPLIYTLPDKDTIKN